MKPPICKVCLSPHWTYEEHKPTSALEEVRKLGADVLGKRRPTFPDPPESVPTTTGPNVPLNRTINGRNKRTKGRPRKWASEADRKRAYRKTAKRPHESNVSTG